MADIEMKQMKILNSVLLEKLSEAKDRIEKLEEENQIFKSECAKIKDELTKIKGENNKLVAEMDTFKRHFQTSEKNPVEKFKSLNEIKREIARQRRNKEKVMRFPDEDGGEKNHIVKSCTESLNHKGHLKNHYKTAVIKAEKIVFKSPNEIKREITRQRRNREKVMSGGAKCHICDKEFSTKQNRATHIKSIHQNKTKYVTCDKCGKTYKSAFSLNRHKKIHLSNVEKEEKYYKCQNCFKLFSRSDNLKNHAKIHNQFGNT